MGRPQSHSLTLGKLHTAHQSLINSNEMNPEMENGSANSLLG